MARPIARGFQPDTAMHPGEILAEEIETRGITQSELARRMGRPFQAISEIINGKKALTATTALELEQVLGVPATLWNNLQKGYESDCARIERDGLLRAEAAQLERFPIANMVRLGWLPRTRDPLTRVRDLLDFLGTASIAAWDNLALDCAFHRSPSTTDDPVATAVWLRKGELEARGCPCGTYEATAFRRALRDIRAELRRAPHEALRGAVEACARAGVALVFVPRLKATAVTGAARWLSNGRPLIQLSDRYRREDHLWFAFFHEACHILRHGRSRAFVEDQAGGDLSDEAEVEANGFAWDMLLPAARFLEFVKRGDFTTATVRQFAEKLGVPPGVVVGRLQSEKLIRPNALNDLRRPVGPICAASSDTSNQAS